MFNVIKKSEEISALFNSGKYISLKYFTIIWEECENTRVAFIAGKKLGGAVKRNFLKRRLRSLYRENFEIFQNKKVLLLAKQRLLTANYLEAENDLKRIKWS